MASPINFVPTAASAPGKVLLAGGYLVLDRQYEGLVFGLSARIHAFIQPLPVDLKVNGHQHIVRSPQFIDAEWRYQRDVVAKDKAEGVRLVQVSSGSQNPFVKTTLEFCLSYALSQGLSPADSTLITILADDAYYSSSPSSGVSAGDRTDRFKSFGVSLSDAHKTGLGSSAALVTSLTAAIYTYHFRQTQLDISRDELLRRVHNLAQAAHCAAQGKVGSGFDVAAAVYGSCIYRRFSPSILDGLGNCDSDGFSERLRSVVEGKRDGYIWDTQISKGVCIPKGLRLVTCDVDCGSQTVGMVKKVLAWRQSEAGPANAIWTALDKKNKHLIQLLNANHSLQEQLEPLQLALSSLRSSIRDMSAASGVPIEPSSQTRLLDACNAIEGVVGGVVPGAGGYDAIALLIKDDESVIRSLRTLFSELVSHPVEGASGELNVHILDVREESDGLKLEDLSVYEPWKVV